MFRFHNNLRGQFTRISQSNVTRIEIFGTESGSLTECSTNDASTHVCGTSIGWRELMAREVSGGSGEIRIGQGLEISSEQRCFLEFLCRSSNCIRTLSESLKRSGRNNRPLGA